ncbi:MAG: ATP-grasp domain-containing protein [Acidobacteriia bacterium]|nr:ATP-grasp domain-containing protein [Terriglobia bacterium]
MLIPATDAALAVIGEHDAKLREVAYVACPPADIVQRILNKGITLDFARRAGIRAPRTFRISSLSELKVISHELEFPVIAKPSHKSSETDFKVRYFQDYETLCGALAADDQLARRVLLQEFVQGDGVGVEALMHRGEPIAMFQHRRLKEVPSTGGAAAVAIAEPLEPFLSDQAVALLRALEWEGVAMVEFRYDRSHRQSALMEVNGRYWGTLALPIKAGIDFPWYEWQIAHGERPSVQRTYSVGLRWRWTAGYVRRWHGVVAGSVKRALKRPGALREVIPSLADLSPFTHDALWSFADPVPAISEGFRQAKKLLSSDAWSVLRKVLRHRPRKGTGYSNRLATSEHTAEKSKIHA